MNRERVGDFAMGLFVLAGLAVLVSGSLWIAGSSLFVSTPATYRVFLEDSAGVEVGDRVRMAGVPIGKITRVELEPDDEWKVHLEVAIRREVELHEDADAVIETSGILGAAFVQVQPGSADQPPLAPGGTIYGSGGSGLAATLDQVEEISGRLVDVLEDTSHLLNQVSSQLDPLMTQLTAMLSPANVENLSAILSEARDTLADLGPKVTPLLEQLDELAGSADASLAGLPDTLASLERLSTSLNAALGEDGDRLAELLESANGTLAEADDALGLVTRNRTAIEAALGDLAATTANLRAFSEQVRKRPSSLVRGSAPRDRRPGEIPAGSLSP